VLAETVDVGDSTVGFHAQQAVEKALKVTLVLAEVELSRAHDLELLEEQVKPQASTPPQLTDLAWLTPWAATLRYDEPIPLDRAAALTTAESVCAWATDMLARTERDEAT